MDQLISDSVDVIRCNLDTLQVIYDYMDSGDGLNRKLRSQVMLTTDEKDLVIALTKLIQQVTVTQDMTLYRGVNRGFSQLCISSSTI